RSRRAAMQNHGRSWGEAGSSVSRQGDEKEKGRRCCHRRPLIWSLQVASDGLGQSRLRLRDDGGKRFTLVHCDVGQDLPIEFDTSQLEAMHELRIGQALCANARVDALDPKPTKRALLNLAITISVLACLFDGLARDADRVLATA